MEYFFLFLIFITILINTKIENYNIFFLFSNFPEFKKNKKQKFSTDLTMSTRGPESGRHARTGACHVAKVRGELSCETPLPDEPSDEMETK